MQGKGKRNRRGSFASNANKSGASLFSPFLLTNTYQNVVTLCAEKKEYRKTKNNSRHLQTRADRKIFVTQQTTNVFHSKK